jgi:tripartite-type tricarboxylate transporter receptor subunit TctC
VGELSKEINAVLSDQAMKERFAGLGAEPMPMTPAALGRYIAAETDKWAKVVKTAHIKVE